METDTSKIIEGLRGLKTLATCDEDYLLIDASIAALNAARWIPVSERLPEENVIIMYYFEVTGIHVGRYQLTEYGHCFYGAGGFLTGDVTHWKPIPSAPQGGE